MCLKIVTELLFCVETFNIKYGTVTRVGGPPRLATVCRTLTPFLGISLAQAHLETECHKAQVFFMLPLLYYILPKKLLPEQK